MASNNNSNPFTHSNTTPVSVTSYGSPNSSVHQQAVYLAYNNNQYSVPETPQSQYVLPVTILNNENFVFYNNSNDSNMEIDQCKEAVPQYIVNLDGSSKPTDSTSPGINTLSIQSTEKIQEIYKTYPLLNKLVVKKLYTRNLLNIPQALQELDRLHKIEEEKRRDIRLILKEPKKESKSMSRISGDASLKKYIYKNKPFERMTPNLFKKVSIDNDNIVDCDDEGNKHVVDDFIKKRCKAFVADEINGVIQEDPKSLNSKTITYKHKYESSFTQPDAGSIYPWRNSSLNNGEIDLDDETVSESDHDDNHSESNTSSQNTHQPIKSLSSIYPWRNKQNFTNDIISVKEDKPSTSQNPNIQSNLGESAPTVQNEPSSYKPIQPSSNTKIEPLTDEPKFFRTKKLGDLEMKKRTYVTRELNQIRTEKKQLPNSPSKLNENSISRKRKKLINEDYDNVEVSYKKLQETYDLDTYKLSNPIMKSRSKNFLTNEEISAFLDFFNKSSLNELALMPGCSNKKADEIISLRPFKNMPELYDKIAKSSQLSETLVDSCQEVLNMRGMLTKLLMKCERLKFKFEKVMGNCLENRELELPTDQLESRNLIVEQPKNLNANLKLTSYQMVGLNWLNLLHHEKVNGILADEMGLGKTVQTISFLAHLNEMGDVGPHLIVVPSSTLGVWLKELELWSPQLNIVVYHGSQDERKRIRLKIYEGKDFIFNILLTTYNISNGTMEDRALLKRVNFHYGVFDEAHLLKNMLSNRYKNLINFKVRRRLLLTGTPIQNNLLELISLLSFVMPDLFLQHVDFLKKLFQRNTMKKDDENGNESNISEFDQRKIDQSKELLKPFCLRRLKDQVLSQLPEKSTNILFLPLIEEQQVFYDSQLAEMRNSIEKTEKASQSQIGFIMSLRKMSNHPLLLRNHYTEDILKNISQDLLNDKGHENANYDAILDDLMYMNDFQIHITCQLYSHVIGKYSLDNDLIMKSNKFKYLDECLPVYISQGHRILIFSQFTMMLDILEAYLNLNKYCYLRLDGQTPVPDRQDLIDKFNSDSEIKIFILSTKAGGIGINLTGANVVIVHDIDFNPFNDKQAEDRCHRLGQTKKVEVIKLISKNSIEEGILSIANNKLKLEASSSVNSTNVVCTSDNNDDNVNSIKFDPNKKKVKFEMTTIVDIKDESVDDFINDTNITDIEQLIKEAIS